MKRLIAEGVKVQTCVTSPPYWGLRDYGHEGQIGLEKTPEEYTAVMVEVFALVWDLLADDGTLWLNLGDSYSRDPGKGGSGPNGKHDYMPSYGDARKLTSESKGSSDGRVGRGDRAPIRNGSEGLKPKDLVGIPWRVAFALQSAGWYLRSDIIWHKPNPMPESVTDRPTKAHEYIFLLSKQERYYYDAEAIREPAAEASLVRWMQDVERQEGSARAIGKSNGKMKAVGGPYKKDKQRGHGRRHDGFNDRWDHMTKAEQASMGRNKRSVWTVATMPFSGAHFATFPPALIEPCILAGSRPGDIVFDPFIGSGTTGQAAEKLGRQWIGCEIQGEYEPLQKQRTAQTGMVL